MQPIDEPHLREPRYARDQYYIELHGKWSQKTADLLAPTLKSGGRSAGGIRENLTSTTTTTTTTTSRDLMAMHLENYQRALAGGGGGVTSNNSSNQPPRSPPPRPITQVASASTTAGLNTSSRGAAQLETQVLGTPQAVSQSPEVPVSFSSERKVKKSDELFSPMSVQAYEEQRKRIAERQQQLAVPVDIKHNPFQPRPQPSSYTNLIKNTTSEVEVTSSKHVEDMQDEYVRSPPKEKMSTGENLLVKTPIVKMQAIQEKLALIANHQGSLSRNELEALLGDVENILVEEGADVPRRPTPTPQKATPPPQVNRSPPRVNTATSPIRAALSSPPRAPTPPRSPPARVRPFAPTTPPRQKSPMKVVDSFTQATPPPDADAAATNFPNAFIPKASPTPKQPPPQLDHHGVQTASSLLPPTAPPLPPPVQPAAGVEEDQSLALQQFWQTYAYYAAAYQAYASTNSSVGHPGSGQQGGDEFRDSADGSYHQDPYATDAMHYTTRIPRVARGRAESTGVAWGSQPRAYQVPENPARNLDPRVKHRPETTNTPPPGNRGSAARSRSRGKRRERYMTDEEKLREVDEFFEANEFGYVPLSPEKNNVDDNNNRTPRYGSGGGANRSSLQPKYARETVAARTRSEQRRRDQMKREEIKRRKAEEQHRIEREMKARERNHGPVMTAETEKDLMKSRPRWQ